MLILDLLFFADTCSGKINEERKYLEEWTIVNVINESFLNLCEESVYINKIYLKK